MKNNDLQQTPWHLIFVILLIGISSAFYIGKVPPALPYMRRELTLTLLNAGWIISIFNALGTFLGIAAGLMADRVGPRKVIIISLLLLPLGSLIGGFTSSVEILLFSRALEGMGYAALFVSSPALIARISTPKNRAATVSLWSSTTPIGMALAVVLAPLLVGPYGWRSLWVCTALISLFFLIMFRLCVLPEHQGNTNKLNTHWKNIKITLTRQGPWLLAIAFMSYTFQWMAIMVWLPTFAIEERGLTLSTTAVLSSIAIAVNIPGNWLGSYLIHVGVYRWVLISVGTSVMGFSPLIIFSDYFSDLVRFGIVLLFSFVGGIQPAALISGPTFLSPSPTQFGVTNGLMYQGSQCGQFIGPPAIAAIVTFTNSWEPAGFILLALTLLNLVLAVRIRNLER